MPWLSLLEDKCRLKNRSNIVADLDSHVTTLIKRRKILRHTGQGLSSFDLGGYLHHLRSCRYRALQNDSLADGKDRQSLELLRMRRRLGDLRRFPTGNSEITSSIR